MVTLQLRQLVAQPGQRLHVKEINWSEFDAIFHELDTHLGDRHLYCKRAALPDVAFNFDLSLMFLGDRLYNC